MRTRHFFIVAVLCLASCGRSDSQSERALTSDEAAILAGVQYSNTQVGGAAFEVAAADTTTNSTVSLRGEIDWANHRGRAVVSAQGRESGVVEVTWDLTQIMERRRDVSAILAELGRAPDTWIVRQPDVTNRDLDRVIGIVAQMASTQPDNAILIQQKEGSAFVRTDTWRNTDVKVYRYGQRSLFWLDAQTNELRRFEGNNSQGTRPVIIDFVERKPRTVTLPDASTTIPVSEIQKIYAQSTTP